MVSEYQNEENAEVQKHHTSDALCKAILPPT